MSVITAIKGMNDILPESSFLWQYAEQCVQQVVQSYGYQEIRTPILEPAALFAHAIGEMTDIVSKEMYLFTDKSGELVALRPEGTACVVRAMVEHSLLRTLPQKLWYKGPMFRYERPQKGRYRQFHQWGVEVYGITGPDIDAELLLLSARLWRHFKIDSMLQLEINTLGTPEERQIYRAELIAYFEQYQQALDEDSQRRLHTNPLRILDSKNPAMQDLIQNAPVLTNYLGNASRTHFDGLCQLLSDAQLAYQLNPRLVRGLDYYNNTVFEWTTSALGAQGTVCAGGHYDNLVADHAKTACPAVGFAIGAERLLLLLEQQGLNNALTDPPHAYLILVGAAAEKKGLVFSEHLRNALPKLKLITHCGGGNMKNQFKRADRAGAIVAIILGDEECASDTVTLKPLRSGEEQRRFSTNELIAELAKLCG